MADTIKVKLVRSTISRPAKQKKIVQALGLRKLNQVKSFPDNSATRGVIKKIPHLVQIVE